MIKRILFANFPWYTEPRDDNFGLRGVRAGSRWPHTFPYHRHEPVDGLIPDLVGGYLPFPFWLATAGAYAKELGFEAYVRDSVALGETYDNFYSFFSDYGADTIVVETATATLDHDLGVIATLRGMHQQIRVVLVGLHFELESPDFLDAHPDIDFVVYGEYEAALGKLFEALRDGTELSEIPNLVYRTQQKTQKNAFGKLIALDDLPWPEREDGVPAENYFDGVCGLQRPQLQLMSTRGCPFGCIFCVWPQMFIRGNKYRKRTPQDVVDEILANMKKVPYASFYIDDDTFNISRDFVIELAGLIKKHGLNTIPWGTMGRADLMDREQLEALQEAGLYSIKYGVESSDQRVLDAANKNMNVERNVEGIKMTVEYGIKVHLTFTFGLPNDTPETIEKTIDMACALPCDTVQFSIATPYPGTKMYDLYKERGWLISEKWSDYVGSTTGVTRSEELSSEDLEFYIAEGYRRFAAAEIERNLANSEFPQQLRKKIDQACGSDGKVIVLQSAKVSFTRFLVRMLSEMGMEVHVFTHDRFAGEFELYAKEIHRFSSCGDFHHDVLQEEARALRKKYGFSGAIIPYSNLEGGGYEEVEKVAVELAGTIAVGVNIQGSFLR